MAERLGFVARAGLAAVMLLEGCNNAVPNSTPKPEIPSQTPISGDPGKNYPSFLPRFIDFVDCVSGPTKRTLPYDIDAGAVMTFGGITSLGGEYLSVESLGNGVLTPDLNGQGFGQYVTSERLVVNTPRLKFELTQHVGESHGTAGDATVTCIFPSNSN